MQCKNKDGTKIILRDKTLFIHFPEPRRALSTSFINGGFKEDIQTVLNHHIPPERCNPSELPGGCVEGYLNFLLEKYSLPAYNTTVLLTSAEMENAVIETESYREAEVSALVTAGVDENGGRAGDPVYYYELNGSWQKIGGTINIILLVSGKMTANSFVQAAMTATEAKSAALAELMAPSCYSSGIATGTGTDGIVIAAGGSAPYMFTDAGKHSKLGELIGLTVKKAVKTALERQSGLNPQRQCNAMERLKRFGIYCNDFVRAAEMKGYQNSGKKFLKTLNDLAKEEEIVAMVAGVLHLLDELAWELLSAESVILSGCKYIGISTEKGIEQLKESDLPPEKLLLNFLVETITDLVIERIEKGSES